MLPTARTTTRTQSDRISWHHPATTVHDETQDRHLIDLKLKKILDFIWSNPIQSLLYYTCMANSCPKRSRNTSRIMSVCGEKVTTAMWMPAMRGGWDAWAEGGLG